MHENANKDQDYRERDECLKFIVGPGEVDDEKGLSRNASTLSNSSLKRFGRT